MSQTVTLIEVGLRDGLQREGVFIPTAQKLAWIDGLIAAGLKQIQVTAFVHPKRVPQMADAEAVCAGLRPVSGVTYSGLVLNRKGLERAQAAGLTHVDISLSASETHSHQNANRSVSAALLELGEMVGSAHAAGLTVRGGVQCAFGHSAGDVQPEMVLTLARKLLGMGIHQLALADTAGYANPGQIRALLSQVLPMAGDVPIILHLHDTRGLGLANALAAVEMGIRHLDTAFGGLGGCNFIPEAAGNIATEDTVNMLHSMGYITGVDIAGVAAISAAAAQMFNRPLPGKLYSLLNEVENA